MISQVSSARIASLPAFELRIYDFEQKMGIAGAGIVAEQDDTAKARASSFRLDAISSSVFPFRENRMNDLYSNVPSHRDIQRD